MRKHFGSDVTLDSVDQLAEGWFNAVCVVSFRGQNGRMDVVLKTGVEDSKYILSYEKEIMRAELSVYDMLRDTIVPIPKILVRDFSREIVPCNYFIMEKLRGDHWGHLESKISPENREELIAELARYTAAFHKIKGSWFGYIKDDVSFQYPTWRAAFQGMVHLVIRDAKKGKVDLPYDRILDALEPLWVILDEITEPCLVNFDMWNKNIMLIERDGVYHIDGIIDHERAFYGDPYAEFISSNTICGDVENDQCFQENYSRISGKPFTYTQNDRIRLCMYRLYLMLLVGAEVYRYNAEDAQNMLNFCREKLGEELENLQKTVHP